MKPSNSPTQGHPNARKIRLKVAFRPLFPTANSFSWVRIGFIYELDYKKPNPTKVSANTLLRTGVVLVVLRRRDALPCRFLPVAPRRVSCSVRCVRFCFREGFVFVTRGSLRYCCGWTAHGLRRQPTRTAGPGQGEHHSVPLIVCCRASRIGT